MSHKVEPTCEDSIFFVLANNLLKTRPDSCDSWVFSYENHARFPPIGSNLERLPKFRIHQVLVKNKTAKKTGCTMCQTFSCFFLAQCRRIVNLNILPSTKNSTKLEGTKRKPSQPALRCTFLTSKHIIEGDTSQQKHQCKCKQNSENPVKWHNLL